MGQDRKTFPILLYSTVLLCAYGRAFVRMYKDKVPIYLPAGIRTARNVHIQCQTADAGSQIPKPDSPTRPFPGALETEADVTDILLLPCLLQCVQYVVIQCLERVGNYLPTSTLPNQTGGVKIQQLPISSAYLRMGSEAVSQLGLAQHLHTLHTVTNVVMVL